MLEGVKRTCAEQFKEAPIAKILILTGIALLIITAILGKVYAHHLGLRHEAFIHTRGYCNSYEELIEWEGKLNKYTNLATKDLSSMLVLGSASAITLIGGLLLLAAQQKVKNEKKSRLFLGMYVVGGLAICATIPLWIFFAGQYHAVAASLKQPFNFSNFRDGLTKTQEIGRNVYDGSQKIYLLGLAGTLTAAIGLPLFLFGAKGMCSKKKPEESTGIEFVMKPLPKPVGSLNDKQGEL